MSLMEKHKPTFLHLVPPLARFFQHDDDDDYDDDDNDDDDQDDDDDDDCHDGL